jgi:hypothetical protein
MELDALFCGDLKAIMASALSNHSPIFLVSSAAKINLLEMRSFLVS